MHLKNKFLFFDPPTLVHGGRILALMGHRVSSSSQAPTWPRCVLYLIQISLGEYVTFSSLECVFPPESQTGMGEEGQMLFLSLLFVNNQLKINIPKGQTFGPFHILLHVTVQFSCHCLWKDCRFLLCSLGSFAKY